MREITKEDWKVILVQYSTSPIVARAMDLQPSGLHIYCITELYRKYRLGDWNNSVPDPKSLPDMQYFKELNDEIIVFHKDHEKFGAHILECSMGYNSRAFVFFDYAALKPAFDALDEDQDLDYIPTYYALPTDRTDCALYSRFW